MLSLIIDFEARFAKFQDGLSQMQRDTKRAAGQVNSAFNAVRNTLGLVGVGLSAGAFTSFAKSVIDVADKLDDMSKRTGVAVEALNGMQYAFTLNGAEAGDLEVGLRNINKAISEAGTGSAKVQQLFRDLGMEDAARGAVDATAALNQLAAAFPRLSEADRTRVSMELLGKAGERLAPTLAQGADAFKELVAEGQKLNPITGELAAQAGQFSDSIQKLSTSFRASLLPALNASIPTLNAIVDAMGEAAREGGVLKAAWVALGGVGAAVFTDDLLTGAQKAEKEIRGINDQIERLKSGSNTGAENAGAFGEFALITSGAESAAAQIDTLIKKRTELQKVVDQSNAKAAEAPKAAKPKEPELKLTSDGNEKVLKAQLDSRLEIIKRQFEEEGSIFGARNKALELFYQQDLISTKEYFAGKNVAAEEALNKQRALLDKEAETLRGAIAKAPKEEEKIKLQDKLAEVSEKRRKVEQEAAENALQSWAAERDALKSYQNKLSELTAQLADARGQTAQSAAIRFDIQAQSLEGEAARNPAVKQQLEDLRTLQIAQAEFNQLKQDAALIEEALATTEKRLQTSREAGAIGELELLQKLSEERTKSAAQLSDIAAKLGGVAIASNDPRLIQGSSAFRAELEALQQQTDLVGKKFDGIFKDSLGGFFDDVVTGTKSVSDAFDDMAKNILGQLSKIATQAIAEDLFGKVAGSPSGAASGGGGGASIVGSLLGALFSANGNAFDGSGNVVHAFANGGVVNSPTFFKFAQGAGVMGEAGPEAIIPLSRGSDGKLGVRGGGGVTINQSFAPGTDSRTIDQAARKAGDAALRAQRRNG